MSIRRIVAVLILCWFPWLDLHKPRQHQRRRKILIARNQPTPKDSRCNDPRDSLLADFYLGEAVDNFGGDETLGYLNPQDANKNLLRAIGDVISSTAWPANEATTDSSGSTARPCMEYAAKMLTAKTRIPSSFPSVRTTSAQ